MKSNTISIGNSIQKKVLFTSFVIIVVIGVILVFGHFVVRVNGKLMLANKSSLEISGSKVTDNDLKNLKYLTHLQELYLIATFNITDISFINEMKELKTLSIESQNITNIDLIGNCQSLETIRLFFTNLTDLDFIANNNNLRTLDIYTGNPVHDISGLKNMKKIECLSIKSSELKDITPIGSLENLTILRLSCS